MKAIDKIDPGLIQFATVRQLEFIDAIEAHGSQSAACAALGLGRNTIAESMNKLRQRAARQGYSPEHDWNQPVPDTHVAKGVSTYYDSEGKVRGQWVKADLKAGVAEAQLQAIAKAMAEEVPRVAPVPLPAMTRDELATLYTLTDSHVGMLAWHKEAGEDWDLAIAESTLVGCFEQMIQAAPPSSIGIVNQLGDFLHADSVTPVTPTSGHLLDTDGRFEKVARVAVRILRRVIGLALEKHQKVIVLMAEGNHDITSSIWLRVMFAALYENEPRVHVIDSALPYYAVQHGKTMLAFHHGHLKKNDQLPMLFAAQFSQMWGLTTKRYAHTGHRHHVEEKEHSGMTVVQHPTLAARDAYAARGGWIAERQVSCITYHKAYGQVSKVTIVPEMLA
jgi:hypothetical protein